MMPIDQPDFPQDGEAQGDVQKPVSPSSAQAPVPGTKVPQIPIPPPGMIICPRCTAIWGGLNTCHCPACHRTFTVIAANDKHRAGSHARDERHCLEPSRVGLVDAGRAYPCWGFPGVRESEND
jgi:hypothetical protein